MWGEKNGGRAKHPRNESKSHQKKTVHNQQVSRFRNRKGRVGSSSFSEHSRSSLYGALSWKILVS